MHCNICGGTAFLDMPKRPLARCADCGSLERTRMAALHIKALGLADGAHILHFAPERGLARLLQGIGGENYRAVDIAPEAYADVGVPVGAFDLCRDGFHLKPATFDLIVHNHVLEHIACNYTVVLTQLARSLKPDGVMLFSVPIVGDDYWEEMTRPETINPERFGDYGHRRHFGRAFIADTLGMLFHLDTTYDATRNFPADVLRDANIPERLWHGFSGASIFAVRRGDLRI
ncbi:class I SAM-dependent methyltransferase [Chelatococcus asaccharovorans]|uniref:Methyltransferase family protein n=1 Tax=Chelatococcus asaccharovorans TaxID=28210 RepID=A0A2V3UBK5_9HYPH|nr:methyltransferase domain-containing protein [Chelatococcus asaccharovorans]MBS7704391.1 methyltransferase domain-containing protein [Chelatococcus asaccharovorans]PXW55730.1 methyltransferase family protein [Chelatococcus asaccharovorans]CAH1664061.1 Methyltransferase family protein [Chelatococcus asaccharovorans]CAH1682569.1 Methyltransferase family protein [Chelatococcus asaccharovorans]